METIDALVDQKLEEDTDFQNSLADLSEEDKVTAITNKRTEIANQEFKSLSEKAQEADKQKELANNYKIRAEKAELEIKKGKKPADAGGEDSKKESDLTPTDLYALMNAKVPEEDVEEVTKAAKLLGKTVSEALKDNVVKSILSRRVEERETANVANTGNTRRTNPAISGQKLLEDLSKGEVPKPGSKEAETLFWAKRGGKK